jgi:thiosulfate reductase cytochrome b subunit
MADLVPRHRPVVRITHWITVLCFFALLVTGVEILISHPRFYWGEAGNALAPPLFILPIPASRVLVPTGYNFVLPDQNGWSRALHFQAAWLVVFTGLLYGTFGLVTRHFRHNLIPATADLTPRSLSAEIANHLRFRQTHSASCNVLQRLAYLSVIFVAFPLTIWTGLAMSPGIASAFPIVVTTFGGQQSARTLHFFLTIFLVLFVVVHVAMVYRAGFRARMSAMITGRNDLKENP